VLGDGWRNKGRASNAETSSPDVHPSPGVRGVRSGASIALIIAPELATAAPEVVGHQTAQALLPWPQRLPPGACMSRRLTYYLGERCKAPASADGWQTADELDTALLLQWMH
jgi:hypothetical protein